MTWGAKPLGEFCKLVNGKAFKADDWSEAGLPIIRIQNLNDATKPFNHWDGGLERQVHVQEGDLLIAWSGTPGTSFGAHIWAGPEGVLNQHIFRVDPLNGEITKDWLKFCVNTQLLRLIAQAHGGVGLKHVTKGAVESVQIPLPPLVEQKRIAGILDAADALRAKRRESLAQLDTLLQSTFLDMFGDPVTNPMGWEMNELDELSVVQTGSTPPSKLEGMFDGEVPFITPSALRETWIESSRTVTEAGAGKSRTVSRGATLVCCIGATIGKMGKASGFSAFNQQINAVTWGERVADNFGLELMRFFKQQIATAGASTTLPILKKSLFQRISVPVPPLAEQNRFATIVESIEQQKARQRAHLDELDTLFASLQSRAFRGDL